MTGLVASYAIIDSIRRMLAEYTVGDRVQYAALADSEAYRAYRLQVDLLRGFDLLSLGTDDEKKAFWINLYNALLIDTVIGRKIDKTLQESRGVFASTGYTVGQFWFSADDIEHGILRCNRRHPARLRRPFAADDPRQKLVLNQFDARVHFALNCAAKSCPPIRFYDAEKIDVQLDLAARASINGGMLALDKAAYTVSLSRIFMWYASDFGASLFGLLGGRRLVAYAARYVQDPGDRTFLQDHLARLKVRFMAYDWGLNRYDE